MTPRQILVRDFSEALDAMESAIIARDAEQTHKCRVLLQVLLGRALSMQDRV